MFEHFARKLQALVFEVAVVLARHLQLLEIQLDLELTFLAPGFEQQAACLLYTSDAADE